MNLLKFGLLLINIFKGVLCTIDTPNNKEIEMYNQLIKLRSEGYTYPGGKYYPPNNKPLLFDCKLWNGARQYSYAMATNNFYAHISPIDGSSPPDRMTKYGYIIEGAFGENLDVSFSSAEQTLERLKTFDPGHCNNLFNDWTSIGIGFIENPNSQYKYYWTQDFGVTTKAQDVSCNPPQYNLNTQTTITTSNLPSDCIDLQPQNCIQYKGYENTVYCTNAYANGWAFINCKKTCKIC